MWTVESIKAALPDVAVQIGSDVIMGRVHDRENSFATVTVKGGKLPGLRFEYTWSTIVHSLNANTPLTV